MQNNSKDIPHIDAQIEDAKATLTRIIGFIYNCDTKSGMVLAGAGVMSVFLGTSGAIKKISYIFININNNPPIMAVIFTLALLVCAYFFFRGIYKLSCAISANLVPSGKNLRTYFGDIGVMEIEVYKKSFLQHTKQEIIDDLLEQIHVNSVVCTKKYHYYNRGLSYIRYFVCCLIPTLLFGCFIS